MMKRLHQFWWWNQEFCLTFLKLLRTNVSVRVDFALPTTFHTTFSCNQFPSNILSNAKNRPLFEWIPYFFDDHEQNESTFNGETVGFTSGSKKLLLTTLIADESLISTGRKTEVFFERTKTNPKKGWTIFLENK